MTATPTTVLLVDDHELIRSGLAGVFDLEQDAKAFNKVLPRVRILDIESFDPTAYL